MENRELVGPGVGGDMTERIAYGVADAGEQIGLSRRTICELIASGRLASIKVGRRRLVRHVDLIDFINRQVDAA